MRRYSVIALLVSIIFVATFAGTCSATPLGTSFTYQGKLTDVAGKPLSGAYTISFKLFDAATGGNQIGSTFAPGSVTVSGGLFSVNLDFGVSPFTGQKLWLETAVGSQTLSPRIELTSVPTAIYAQTVASGALSSYTGNIQALAQPTVNPTVVGSVATNGVPQTLAVSGRYVYVTSYGGNNYTAQVIDVSNPASPTTVGSGITGIGTELQFVAVSGGYAYATNSANRKLKVVDISNPGSPTEVGGVLTSDSGSNPTSVAVSGRYAYVTSTTGSRFQSIDISNPANPVIVGAGPTGPAGGSDLRFVTISGRYAYVADTSGNRLYIFDISNPASILSVSSIVTAGSPCSVAVSGRYAYVVNNTAYSMQVFDVSVPASPKLVSTVSTDVAPVSVAVAGRYVCVINMGSNTMQVFDVSNPASPSLAGTATTKGGPCWVAVSGRYAYVASRGYNLLQVIDITGIESTAITAHSFEAGSLQVRESGVISNQLSVGGSVNVGKGGIYSAGSIASTGSINTASSINAGGNITALGSSIVLMNGYFGGNLGIGNALPTQRLQVDDGDAIIRGNYNFVMGGDEARLYLGDTNNYIKAVYGGGLRLGTYNGTDSLCLSNDKVGVGTTNPITKLEINGTEVSDSDNLYGPLAIKENTNNVDTPAGKTVLALKRAGKFNAAYDNSAAFQLKRYSTSGTPAYTQMDILLGNNYTSKPDTTVMSLQAGGNVGIGTTTPSYKLDVNGTMRCTTLTQTSDARFKTNIEPLTNALDSVAKLRGVTFNWKPGMGYPEGRQIGLIAQEVEKVYPELVSTDPEGYKSVAYDKLVPVLLESIKTLEQRNSDLESRLERLEKLMEERNDK